MKSTKREVLLQLWKEFWFPLVVAFIWLGLNILFSGNPKADLLKIINVFGTGFFFFSFLTGQYNRVKKQLTVEKNLDSVENRILNLTNDLEAKTSSLLHNITGGDSYIDFMIIKDQSSGIRTMYVRNKGDFMMYDISITIDDYSKRGLWISKAKESEKIEIFDKATKDFNLGNFPKNAFQKLGIYTVEEDQKHIRLDVSVIARNGSYLCKLFFTNINTPDEKHATEISKLALENGVDIVLFHQADKNFPKDENQAIVW